MNVKYGCGHLGGQVRQIKSRLSAERQTDQEKCFIERDAKKMGSGYVAAGALIDPRIHICSEASPGGTVSSLGPYAVC